MELSSWGKLKLQVQNKNINFSPVEAGKQEVVVQCRMTAIDRLIRGAIIERANN